MKVSTRVLAFALLSGSAVAFTSPSTHRRETRLAVLEKPQEKKLAKIEQLKIDSKGLIHPLKEVRTFPQPCRSTTQRHASEDCPTEVMK